MKFLRIFPFDWLLRNADKHNNNESNKNNSIHILSSIAQIIYFKRQDFNQCRTCNNIDKHWTRKMDVLLHLIYI